MIRGPGEYNSVEESIGSNYIEAFSIGELLLSTLLHIEDVETGYL